MSNIGQMEEFLLIVTQGQRFYLNSMAQGRKCGKSCTGYLTFCLEMTHVSSAHISLVAISHMVTPNFKRTGKHNPTMCQER